MKVSLISASAFSASASVALLAASAMAQEGDVVYTRRPPAKSQPVVAARPLQGGPMMGQSAVQRQLQQMYERDGREMPVMDVNQIPSSAPTYHPPAQQTAHPAQAATMQRPVQQPSSVPVQAAGFPRQSQAAPPAKRGFFSRLVPSFLRRKDRDEAPEKSDELQPPPGQLPFDVAPDEDREAPAPRENFARRQPPQPQQQPQIQQQPQRTANAPRALPQDRFVQQPRSQTYAQHPAEQQPIARQPVPQQPVPQQPVAQPRPMPMEELIDESSVQEDAEEMIDLGESLTPPEPTRRGAPPTEIVEDTPFTGLTINPAERETELADETPQFPDEPAAIELPSISAGPRTAGPGPAGKAPAREPARQPVPEVSRTVEMDTSTNDEPELPELPMLSDVEPEPTPASQGPKLNSPAPRLSAPPRLSPPLKSEPVKPEPAKPESDNAPVNLEETSTDPVEAAFPKLRSTGEELAGLDSYCVVTLKTELKRVKGKEEFRSVYQGNTYRFASAAAQKEFEADPAAFAPALKGQDAVLLIDGDKSIPGSINHAVWYKGTLYMFSNEKTMNTFAASPARFAKAR